MLDFWRGHMSVRRLQVLLARLLNDPGSELSQSLTPSLRQHRSERILADLWDITALAGGLRNPATGTAPVYPRPGEEEAEALQQQQRLDAMRQQQRRNQQRMKEEGGGG